MALAHLAHFPLATIPNPDWPVHSALCMIGSSQKINMAGLCVVFVKGNFHQIIKN